MHTTVRQVAEDRRRREWTRPDNGLSWCAVVLSYFCVILHSSVASVCAF